MQIPDTDSAVGSAEELFFQRHIFWAKPLVDLLSNAAPLLALRWAIQAFRQVALSERQSTWTEWLATLEHLAEEESKQASEKCLERSREIWICGGPVSLVQRGISRLYGSLGVFLQGNVAEYKVEVIRAMCLLADDFDDNWHEDVFRRAVSTFALMAEDPRGSPGPG